MLADVAVDVRTLISANPERRNSRLSIPWIICQTFADGGFVAQSQRRSAGPSKGRIALLLKMDPKSLHVKKMPIPLVRLNARVCRTYMPSFIKFMPAAQWSRHSCLQFNKLVNTGPTMGFSWFDCEPQAHEQLSYMLERADVLISRKASLRTDC